MTFKLKAYKGDVWGLKNKSSSHFISDTNVHVIDKVVVISNSSISRSVN